VPRTLISRSSLPRILIRSAVAACCAQALLLTATPAPARSAPASDDYPTKPLRIIVASSGGTAEDFFARKVGEALQGAYRQRVVIDNRSGAGGLIGNALVSRAQADGYTLGMVGVTRIINELMRPEPPYRSLADVAAVAHVASITNVLVVAPTVRASTAAQFVGYARVRPGELNYASLGIGSASHLGGEIFTRALGLDAVHVPFTRFSDSVVEMMLGRVHYAVLPLPAVLGAVHQQRLRALAVMTRSRSPALPSVPAIAEVGLPAAQFDRWSGIVAPRGTPRRIVEQLHGDIVRALGKPELRELFARQGAESTPESTPDGFMRFMQEEYLHYQALMRHVAIRPE
jgi:tripartite-type tricarboxylate transporter receptor subunit TctC